MVSTVKIGSLKSLLKVKPKTQETALNVLEEPKQEIQAAKLSPISKENATTLLANYAKKLVGKNRKGLETYLADAIIQVNEGQLSFVVASKHLAQEMADERINLLKAFKKNQIDLEDFNVKIDVKEVEKYKVFTPKQEFDQLALDNPVLKDFEQRFGLDFDA